MARRRYGTRLDPAAWPERDRAAWLAARAPTAILDESGHALWWSAETARFNERSYGYWLSFLMERGLLDPEAPAGSRILAAWLIAYANDVGAYLALRTVMSRLHGLSQMIRVIDPEADREPLGRLMRQLGRAAPPARDQVSKVVSPAVLFRAGIARMERLERDTRMRIEVRAACYRDGLMIALLASRPLRVSNLVSMQIGRHLVHTGAAYCCRFDPHETKNRRPLDLPLPEALTPWVDRYLAVHRPALLGSVRSDAVWVATRRASISRSMVYNRLCRATEEETGARVNPHLFRDCVATAIAVQDPEHVGITPRLLGHAGHRTAERHYTHAGSAAASRRFNEVLLDLRAKALAAADGALMSSTSYKRSRVERTPP